MAEKAYNGPTCTYCGGVDVYRGWHQDHVTPRGWGRSSTVIVLACPSCNGSKGNKDPVLWFAELVHRHGAVVGRGETYEDNVATRIWERWSAEIQTFAAALTNGASVPLATKEAV